MKKQTKNLSPKVTFMILFIIGIILAGAFYIVTEKRKQNSEETHSEYDILMNKDLVTAYPATPREVVKLYGRFSICIYNESMGEEEFQKISEKVCILYDTELKSNNPIEDYVYNLKNEVADYQANDRTITSYSVESSENIETWVDNNIDYAKLNITYMIKEKDENYKSIEEFILRKNENKQWKILGFQQINTEKTE